MTGGYTDYKQLLNRGLLEASIIEGTEKASVSYIDDTALLSPKSSIEQYQAKARKHCQGNPWIRWLYCAPKEHSVGAASCRNYWLVGSWTLGTTGGWCARSPPQAIDRMYATVHLVLPGNFCDEDAEVYVTRRRTLVLVASLLSRFSVLGLSVGSAFVHSLFKMLVLMVGRRLELEGDISW